MTATQKFALFFDDDDEGVNFTEELISLCPNVIPILVAQPSEELISQNNYSWITRKFIEKFPDEPLERIVSKKNGGLCIPCITYYTDVVDTHKKNLIALIFDFDKTLSIHAGLFVEGLYAHILQEHIGGWGVNGEKEDKLDGLINPVVGGNLSDKDRKWAKHVLKEDIFGLKRAESLIKLFQAADNYHIPIFILTTAPNADVQCKILTFLGFPGIKGCISIGNKKIYHPDTFSEVQLKDLSKCRNTAVHDWNLNGTQKYHVIKSIIENCLEMECSELEDEFHTNIQSMKLLGLMDDATTPEPSGRKRDEFWTSWDLDNWCGVYKSESERERERDEKNTHPEEAGKTCVKSQDEIELSLQNLTTKEPQFIQDIINFDKLRSFSLPSMKPQSVGKPCEGSGRITGKCQGSCQSGYSCEEESKTMSGDEELELNRWNLSSPTTTTPSAPPTHTPRPKSVTQCQCQEMKDKESVSEKYTTLWLNSEQMNMKNEDHKFMMAHNVKYGFDDFHHQFNDIERLLQLDPSEANKKRVKRIIKDITYILDFNRQYDEDFFRFESFDELEIGVNEEVDKWYQNWEARDNYATRYITWSTGNPYAYNDISYIDLDELEKGTYDE